MLTAVENRRSIRKYQDRPVSPADLEQILRAGMLAPSSKNRQPWKFIVVSGAARSGLMAAVRDGLAREREAPLLPNSRAYQGGAAHSLHIMEQAPVLIVIVNPLGAPLRTPLTLEERVYELCNAQSIGAAAENMTLAATALGLGSLWICDIYFSYPELCDWLGIEGEPAAVLAVGYAAEAPAARPRKRWEDAVEWRS
ncbi:MAG: nitroreductase family protein [Clostridiales bacterium]|nr:nitroreductase family protein [Clostridiales bacterium]